MNFYLLIILLSLSDLVGISMAKYWHLKHNNLYLLASILSFAAAAVFLALSLKYEGAAIVNIIWVALSAILITFVGYFVFKEPIAIHQFIGIFVILIGLIIIQWK